MDDGINLNDIVVGTSLPEVERLVTQENINLYAEVSQDYNPIHIDPEFARKTPLGGTIAHGMLTLAFVSQVMTLAFGQRWLTGGKLGIRFKTPVRPGDTISATAKVSKIEQSDEYTTIYCEVLCGNQKGETVITGETQVRIKK